ncbi:MAG: hypothetical protein STSR0008_23830 [Ignavibacterium sp.]
MKKMIFIFLILLLSSISVYSQVKVRSYFRKDGTYVQSHYRTYPDGNIFNNWSTKGNINPYSGKEGTIDPYKISIPRTKVYSNYVHYPYISTNNNIDRTEIIKQEIKTIDSKEYIVIRKKGSKNAIPSNNNRRIIIYD